MWFIQLVLLILGVNCAVSGQSLQAFQLMEACADWRCAAELLFDHMDEGQDLSVPWRLPLRHAGYLSSAYGYRTHPIHGSRKFHSGVDIAAPIGSLVYAAGNGQSQYGHDSALGHYIEVDHLNGFVSVYGHLSGALIPDGVVVKQGQAIGVIGESGLATGPHLHWSVTFRGRSVDPLSLRSLVLSFL